LIALSAAMLSFVINSIDAEKFASVSQSIERAMAGTPYEIVGIHDARSMCDGYRRGLARSAGDPVVFCHDDIELLMPDLPMRLARHLERFDVFAPVGTRKLVSMSWMDAGAEYVFGAMSGPQPDGSLSTGYFGGDTREIDGIVGLEGGQVQSCGGQRPPHATTDQHFVIVEHGKRFLTPLAVALVLVETTDLIFAVDSIPAIFAVTKDPFLVYTSNVCAILGLRSLYFLLAGVINKFHLLKLGIAAVLTFVGVKMLISSVYEIPILVSLLVIIGVLATSVVASIVFPKADTR